MNRYFDPEKIEEMGRKISKEEADKFAATTSAYLAVAFLSNGFQFIAINMSRPQYREEINALLGSKKYSSADYYRIPAKYAHLFDGRVVMANPSLP